jgi:hypothetical protein
LKPNLLSEPGFIEFDRDPAADRIRDLCNKSTIDERWPFKSIFSRIELIRGFCQSLWLLAGRAQRRRNFSNPSFSTQNRTKVSSERAWKNCSFAQNLRHSSNSTRHGTIHLLVQDRVSLLQPLKFSMVQYRHSRHRRHSIIPRLTPVAQVPPMRMLE